MQWSINDFLKEQRRSLTKIHPDLDAYFVPIRDEQGSIDFLPIGTFRKFHVFSESLAARTFLSSGSTNEVRAQHSFSQDGLTRYQKDASRNFCNFLISLGIPKDAPIISLIPRTSEWPQSSLAAMIEMFQESGCNVIYLDELEHVNADQFIVFGTSFHHLLFAQDPQREQLLSQVNGKRVIVIDTGGTKGRTRSYSLEEVHKIIQQNFTAAACCEVVSEYGMCELSSQAWSLCAPHDGWFRANDTLRPFILDLDDRTVVNESERIGFLAFIDTNNQDSYPAIITEDLAMMSATYPDCFKLVGRAPDASIKGCSLNVKGTFVEASHDGVSSINNASKPNSLSDVTEKLDPESWDVYARKDLLRALESIPENGDEFEKTRSGQRVLMVLSANIPITFLYPAFMFLFRGARELHLQLPSLRPLDPYSERVRRQIETLAEAISPFLKPMNLFLYEGRDVSFSILKNFDAVMVFGSDETIKTFQAALPQSGGTELIALGDVLNGHSLSDDDSPKGVAEICSQWLGRGCLTPVALVGESITDRFVDEFKKEFEIVFKERLLAAGAFQPFTHRHRILEIESILKSRGKDPNDHVMSNKNTFVVDLRHQQIDSRLGVALREGGSGLISIVSNIGPAELNLCFYPNVPKFHDKHTMKSWDEWV